LRGYRALGTAARRAAIRRLGGGSGNGILSYRRHRVDTAGYRRRCLLERSVHRRSDVIRPG
jgi:hypothetical protein